MTILQFFNHYLPATKLHFYSKHSQHSCHQIKRNQFVITKNVFLKHKRADQFPNPHLLNLSPVGQVPTHTENYSFPLEKLNEFSVRESHATLWPPPFCLRGRACFDRRQKHPVPIRIFCGMRWQSSRKSHTTRALIFAFFI